MAYRSLGRDAVRKGDKPLECLERESPRNNVMVKMDAEFHQHLKSVAKDRQISLAQMIRYEMAKNTGYKAPKK